MHERTAKPARTSTGRLATDRAQVLQSPIVAPAAAQPRLGFSSVPVHSPSAVVQRQKKGNKKKSLRQRVREKLQAGQQLAPRDYRVVKPRVTADQLTAAKAKLKRADFGVAHPEYRGIRVRRDDAQSPEHYTDLLRDTRASLSRLDEQPIGHGLLSGLQARTAAVNQGHVGTDRANPATVVDIRSGRGLGPDSANSHRVRHNNTYQDIQRGYRYGGQSGAGIASRVNYDESAARPDRFIGLGHELIHAYRAAHGQMVSPPEVSPQRGHKLLNPPTDPIVKQVIGQHAQLKEEFETVGLSPTPRAPNNPTERGLRAEHIYKPRDNYSGLRPGGPQEQALRNIDEGTDDRDLFDKLRHKIKEDRPSPVAALIRHLES